MDKLPSHLRSGSATHVADCKRQLQCPSLTHAVGSQRKPHLPQLSFPSFFAPETQREEGLSALGRISVQSQGICAVPRSTRDAVQEHLPMKTWQPAFGLGVSKNGMGWGLPAHSLEARSDVWNLHSLAWLKHRAGTVLSRDYSYASDEEDIK